MTPSMRPGQLELSDGTRIAYRVLGDDGPWMLLCNGVTTTHDFWEGPVQRWPGRRILQWDYPGHGASSPAHDPSTAHLPSLAEICVALLDAEGVERASLVGFSMGSQVALLAALEAAHRFDAVVSVLGPAGGLFDTALWGVGGKAASALLRTLPPATTPVLHGALKLAVRSPLTYRVGRLLQLYGRETSPHDIDRVTDHLGRVHAPTVQQMLLSAGRIDLRPRLADLAPPLLIITGERDAFAPAETVGRPMKRWAPQADLVVLDTGTHGSLFGHGSVIADTVSAFLERQR